MTYTKLHIKAAQSLTPSDFDVENNKLWNLGWDCLDSWYDHRESDMWNSDAEWALENHRYDSESEKETLEQQYAFKQEAYSVFAEGLEYFHQLYELLDSVARGGIEDHVKPLNWNKSEYYAGYGHQEFRDWLDEIHEILNRISSGEWSISISDNMDWLNDWDNPVNSR